MSKNKKDKLTRLVLGSLLLGGGTLFAPLAEAGTVTINSSMTTSDSMESAGLYQWTGHSWWYTNYNNWPATKTLTIDSLASEWSSYSFASMIRASAGTPDNFDHAVVTLKTGTVYHLLGTYITGEATGDVKYNEVHLEGGTVTHNIHGGATTTGDTTGNKVEISGGSVGGFIRGGGTNHGSATENNVTIKGGAVTGYVYAGYAGNGDAVGNTITMTGGTVSGGDGVNGGWVVNNGDATGNSITISDGEVTNAIRGGFSNGVEHSAKKNTVTISGTAKVGNVTGGQVNNTNAKAEENTVTITGGTIGTDSTIGVAYGGSSNSGAANNNKVEISGLTTIKSNVIGGLGATSTGNTVEINGGTVNGTAYGGYAYTGGDVTNNTITMRGSTTNVNVIRGGEAISGSATGNIIKVEGGSTTYATGGHVYNNGTGDAISNQVNVSGGTVGGITGGGISTGATGNAQSNVVTITNGSVTGDIKGANVLGTGIAGGDSADLGNKVNISGGTVNGDIFGGYAAGGIAAYNSIEISGGKATANIRGGQGYTDGTTSNNKVIISNSATVGTSTDNSVLGGFSTTGNATYNNVKVSGGEVKGWIAAGLAEGAGTNQQVYHNTTEITGGTIGNTVYGGRARSSGGVASTNYVDISGDNTVINAKVIGGDTAQGTSTSNKVTISGNAQIKNAVYGGSSGDNTDAGNATENTVEIKGGTIGDGSGADDSGTVYGGYTKTGNAASNTVTMTGGKVTGKFALNGGWAETSGNADSNKVTISGGIVEKSVRGGRSYGNNNQANGNTVTISGTAQIKADILAGRATGLKNATAYTANDNIVNINGGTFGENSRIFGGLAGWSGSEIENGTTANNNIVNINVATKVNGIVGGFGQTSTGNTLNLGASGITIGDGGVTYTQTINIGYTDAESTHTVAFENGKTVLSSTGAITGVGTLDISADAAKLAEATTAGNMRLLSGGDSTDFSALNLKYSSAAAAAIPDAGTKVKESTASDAKDGVVLGYTNTHTVKRADTNKAIDYTITNTVNAVTPGEIAWSAGGTARALTAEEQANYTFDGNTTVNAAGMTFTGTSTVNPLNQSMTLLSGATGITGNNITQPGEGKGKLAVAYADAKNITLNATAGGEVSAADGNVKYTVKSVTLNSVDLSNWDGTTDAVPDGWTGTGVAVNTGNFIVPADLAVGESRNIFTTNTADFFGTVSGDRAYSSTTFENSNAGVTLSGNHFGGVKVENNGTTEKANLTYYADTMDTTSITLGKMDWGTGRTAEAGYDFRNVGTIDAAGLSFNFNDEQKAALSKDSKMTLLAGATNLEAGKAVTGKDKTQAIAYTTANGAALSGTLTGEVSTTAGAVNYAATSMTLDSVALSGWDGKTASAVPAGWTAAGVSVATENMTNLPALSAGTSQDILTTEQAGAFSDDNISETNKYKYYDFTPSTAEGVTLSGQQKKGVKAEDSGKKLVYAAGKMDVKNISFAAMDWGKGRTATADYDFANAGTINAEGLSFNFNDEQKAALSKDSKMTLLAGATNLESGKAVTGKDKTQTIAYTTANGAALTGTLTGEVSTAEGSVNYAAKSMTLDSVTLSGWDGTTASAVPAGWTAAGVSVATENMTNLPALSAGTSQDILTTEQAGAFSDDNISETNKYKYYDFTPSTAEGVTLSGQQKKGVKAEDSGKKLVYAAGKMDVKNISFAGMDWDKGRTATSDYDFATVGAIDATGLTLNISDEQKAALSKDSKMTLLAGATNLEAGKAVTGKDKTQAIAYTTANGAALSGTLTGEVSTTAGAVNYAAKSMTLDSVALSGWDGKTASAVPAGWTAAAGLSVSGDGFTEPTLSLGNSVNILTTDTDNYFANASIDSKLVGRAFDYSETAKNISLSGKELRSVKADGKNLVYSSEKANIDTIAVGAITYDKGATLLDKSGAVYDYSSVSAIDTKGFSVTMSEEQAKAAHVNDSMTLVKGNNTLNNIEAVDAGNAGEYSYTPTAGMNVTASLQGSISAADGNVLYSITENNASNITFENVQWNNTYKRADSEAAYTSALVNTTGIVFTGVENLTTGTEMLLVENYGDSIRKSRGDSFKLGEFTGKGYAYYKDGSLYYLVEKGTNTEPEPSVPVEGQTKDVTEDQKGDVTGGEAKGDGNATGNEVDVKSGVTVEGNVTGGKTDGTGESKDNKVNIDGGTVETGQSGRGGDVTGGKSDEGSTTGNEATVNNSSKVDGGVTGGQTEKGEATGNKAVVKGNSDIGTEDGGVTGGRTGEGESKTNEATVEGSTVNGDITGGESGKGETSENKANVKDSVIQPNEKYGDASADVTGGRTGEGNATGNETNVEGTKVTKGDVTGGRTESGDVGGNKTSVTTNSEIKGNVTGGSTEKGDAGKNETKVEGSTVSGNITGGETKSGNATENETTVTSSTVTGDVTGGKTSGTGTSNENKTAVTGGSQVTGNVTGGQSEGGSTDKNETGVTGKSKVTGDVTGGQTKGDGTSNENKTTVSDGSEVGGNVIGGQSENGSTTQNAVSVTEGSTVGGNSYGGYSLTGKTSENNVAVANSEVAGSVYGGTTRGSGETQGNKVEISGNSTIKGDAAGGYSENGTASANTASLTSSHVDGNVYGGKSDTAAVTQNTAQVSSGSVDGNVYGGKTDGAEPADTNTVSLADGAVVKGGVYGGYSENGTASDNVVTINKATINDYLYGGKSKNKSANDKVYFNDGTVLGIIGGGCEVSTDNSVSLTEGTVSEHVIGGFADKTATDNTVTITGGTVMGSVIGGYGADTADGNSIYLGGGTVKGNTLTSAALGGITIAGGVYGGYTSGTGTTQNNSVYLDKTADVSATGLYGGNKDATGNNLYVGMLLKDGTSSTWTGGSQSTQNITNFENINFTAVPWSTTQAALTITDGTNSDLSMTNVSAAQVTFTGVKSLNTNDTMTLLDQSKVAADKQATKVTANSKFTVGNAVEGTGILSRDAKGNVLYKVESVSGSEQTHNTVMGAAAAMTALSAGNDFIGAATEGLSLKENIGDDGVGCYAKIGGSHMKQETGSHVNVNTWNAILALGHKNVQKKSTLEYGAFFEYGKGNYATSNNGLRGDGSVDYTGGGLLGKWKKDNGFYVEGSFRAGTVNEDARNLLRDNVQSYSYNTSANYMGFHIGVGKQITVAHGNVVDVYGKYFYNRKNGVDFTVNGDDYKLDDVTSQIFRIGARYTMKREKWNFYGDAAYEHELDGKASGRVNGAGIRGVDTSGGSFRLELGAELRPDNKTPWSLNLNVTGYAGKKQGVQGGISLKYMF